MAGQKVLFLTPEEYLAGERDAEVKHEYIAGEAYAMAGGTPEHSDIASDTQTALAYCPAWAQLKMRNEQQ